MNIPSLFRRLVAPRPDTGQKPDIGSMIDAALTRGKRKVTASDVAAYVRSPFYLYCEKFVDGSERDESPALEMAAERGLEHESDVTETETEGMDTIRIERPADPREAFRLGMPHMAGGAQVLEQQQLFWLPEGMSGRPDMLVRREGPSALGSHHYSVTEIKSTKDVRPEHKVQGAFYSIMLGSIQQYTPRTFTIINSEKRETEFSVREYEDAARQAIAGARAVLGGFVPRADYGCPAPWASYARRAAGRQLDVTLVLAIGPKRQAALEEKKIRTIHDLLANPAEAMSVSGIGQRQLGHARSLLGGKPVRRQACEAPARLPTEIFVDFEGVPGNPASLPTTYLIGMVVRTESTEYVPFVARSLEQEGRILEDFIRYVDGIPSGCPIWHWSSYERTHLRGMGERHGIDCGPVLGRLADLRRLATDMFTFPVPSTRLKAIEGGVGFERKQVGMDAFEAYRAWSRDPADIDRVLAYNRDDCEAMIRVLDWMRNDGESWNEAYDARRQTFGRKDALGSIQGR